MTSSRTGSTPGSRTTPPSWSQASRPPGARCFGPEGDLEGRRRLRDRAGRAQARRPHHRLQQLQGPLRAVQPRDGPGEAVLRGRAETCTARTRRRWSTAFSASSPVAVSPHNPDVVYHASQYLHRTSDEGVTWERISPDLTANRPERQVISGGPITRDITGEEHYSTIYEVEESPLEPGVIWTGANDGPVYVTRDSGGHVDGRHAPRHAARGPDRDHRALAAHAGQGVLRRLPLPPRRLAALHLPHYGLREDVDAPHRRHQRHSG